MYFLGIALPTEFDGVSYANLTDAQKQKLVEIAIDKKALKIGSFPAINGMPAYDPTHSGTGISIDLNPALDNSVNDSDTAAALNTIQTGSSYYKKLTGYSGTPDKITAIADIKSKTIPSDGYQSPHKTIIGTIPHKVTNQAGYEHAFYDSIFESALSMVKTLDT